MNVEQVVCLALGFIALGFIIFLALGGHKIQKRDDNDYTGYGEYSDMGSKSYRKNDTHREG